MNTIIFVVLCYLIVGTVICIKEWVGNEDYLIRIAKDYCGESRAKYVGLVLLVGVVLAIIVWPIRLYYIFKKY